MRIVFLLTLISQFAFANSEFYFHWGSQNRIEMLLQHKRLNKKAFEVASFGTKNGAYYGNGLYVSINPYKWAHLGEKVLIVFSPDSKLIKPEPLKNSSNLDFIFKTDSPSVHIYSLENGLRAYFKDKAAEINLEKVKDLVKVCFKNDSPLALSVIEEFKNKPEVQKDVSEYLNKIFPSVYEDLKIYSKKISDSKKNRLLWEKQTRVGLGETFSNLRRFFPEKELLKILNLNYVTLEDFFNSLKYNPLVTIENLRNSMPDYKEINAILPNQQWQAWTSAIRTVTNDSALPMSQEVLKTLHKATYPSGSDFKSFYQYQIQNLKEGKTKKEAIRLFESGDIQALRELLKIEEPIGQIRTGAIYITRPGTSSESEHGTYFTEEVIYKLISNPNLKIHIHSSSLEGIKAKIIIPENPNLESEIEKLIKVTNVELEELKQKKLLNHGEYAEQVIRIASDFYWELSPRHIFWDGSGRVARLARDWILEHMGLPPAAYTPENDWELSKEEMRKETKKAVAESMHYYENKDPYPILFLGIADKIQRAKSMYLNFSCRSQVSSQ